MNAVLNKAEKRRDASLLTEMVVALSVLFLAVIPISYSFWKEQTLIRSYFFRAVAMEIIDGEFEVLLAGRWKATPEGLSEYTPRAASARTLPPGKFFIARAPGAITLSWRPSQRDSGGKISRTARIQ